MPDSMVSVLDAANATVNLDTWEIGGQHRQIVHAAAPATAARTSVAAAAADTLLLASNAGRMAFAVFNDSTATLYLAFGAGAASVTSYSVQVPAGAYVEHTFAGELRGIWSSADGAARITEMSA